MDELVVVLDSRWCDEVEKAVEAARLKPEEGFQEGRAAELFNRSVFPSVIRYGNPGSRRVIGVGFSLLDNRIACIPRYYSVSLARGFPQAL